MASSPKLYPIIQSNGRRTRGFWCTISCPWASSVLVARKVCGMLEYIRKSNASRAREVILLLCSALVRHIWSTVSSSGLHSQCNRDRELLEHIQQRATKLFNSLEHLLQGKGAGPVQPQEKKTQRGLHQCLSLSAGRASRGWRQALLRGAKQ